MMGSMNATEKRIMLAGIRAVVPSGFSKSIPEWFRGQWPEWEEEQRKLVFWVILDMLFRGDVEGEVWTEFIHWAKDNVTNESLKWVNKALRHFDAEKLWEL